MGNVVPAPGKGVFTILKVVEGEITQGPKACPAVLTLLPPFICTGSSTELFTRKFVPHSIISKIPSLSSSKSVTSKTPSESVSNKTFTVAEALSQTVELLIWQIWYTTIYVPCAVPLATVIVPFGFKVNPVGAEMLVKVTLLGVACTLLTVSLARTDGTI